MCDVTFPPKSWGNCYVTVQDYRRRFAVHTISNLGLGRRLSLGYELPNSQPLINPSYREFTLNPFS